MLFVISPEQSIVKFIYSEKATKFCEIFILLLSYVVPVKSKAKISQNFVAFSEYMNFSRARRGGRRLMPSSLHKYQIETLGAL